MAEKRPSIYLNPPLEKVKAALKDGQSLSQRLGQIAERYALACSQIPALSDSDRNILSNVLSGSMIEPLLIKHLDSEIEDAAGANVVLDSVDQSALNDLAARVREMSYAERIALIESLGF